MLYSTNGLILPKQDKEEPLMTKKLLALVLAAMLLLSCAPALAEEHGPYWIGEETLTYWIPMDSSQAQTFTTLNEHPFYQWMEEQTGVHIEFIHPSTEQMDQQYNLMLTNNEFYDMMQYAYPDGPQQGIDDKVLLDLNEYKDLMPNYFATIACDDGSYNAWEWGPEKELYWQGAQPAFQPLLTTAKGNLWCVSQVWTDMLNTECGALIRQDWLDELNLEAPKTIEDLEKVLYAFKTLGEDVIPMSIGNYGYNSSDYFLTSAWGINPGWFTVTDGVVDPVAWVTPEFKEYLTYMAKWYQDGLIDPDFMNRDYDGLQALFLSDRLGIWSETWHVPANLHELYEGEDENFEVSPLAPVRLTEDQELKLVQAYDSQASNYVTVWAESEKAEIACRWLDVAFSKEGILKSCYGTEGESYTLVDGVPYYTEWFYDQIDAGVNMMSVYLYQGHGIYWSTRANCLYNAPVHTIEGQQTVASDYVRTQKVWGENSVPEKQIGYVVFDGDGWADMYDPYVEADTYCAPQMMNIITGKADISEFDAIAQKALDMGFEYARNACQAAYNIQHQQPEDYGMDK